MQTETHPVAGDAVPSDAAALYAAASVGFHTSRSSGTDRLYEHNIKFPTLEALHAYEDAWTQMMVRVRDARELAAQPGDFCDGHCTWLDHAPGCPRHEGQQPAQAAPGDGRDAVWCKKASELLPPWQWNMVNDAVKKELRATPPGDDAAGGAK